MLGLFGMSAVEKALIKENKELRDQVSKLREDVDYLQKEIEGIYKFDISEEIDRSLSSYDLEREIVPIVEDVLRSASLKIDL